MKLRTWIDLTCGLVAVTAISICLIGIGENRAARHCSALVDATLAADR